MWWLDNIVFAKDFPWGIEDKIIQNILHNLEGLYSLANKLRQHHWYDTAKHALNAIFEFVNVTCYFVYNML